MNFWGGRSFKFYLSFKSDGSINVHVRLVMFDYHQSKFGFVISHTIYIVSYLYFTVNLRKKRSYLFFVVEI